MRRRRYGSKRISRRKAVSRFRRSSKRSYGRSRKRRMSKRRGTNTKRQVIGYRL